MELKHDFEAQAVEAARRLVEVLKKQIESGLPEEQRLQKQQLIIEVRKIYDLDAS